MALESFKEQTEISGNIDTTGDDVRPYVSEHSHDLVRGFSKNAGMDISLAYDLIIQTVLEDDDLRVEVVERNAGERDKMSLFSHKLLHQIADKTKDLGHFPEPEDVNSDSDMYGFAVYIDAFGSVGRIESLFKKFRQDTYNCISDGELQDADGLG